jgi:response regulator RpfG family c-di-GMP phosphodiesterase
MESKNTILIVDDGELNRAILKKIFEGNYAVLEASNGREAMEKMEQIHDYLAVVLLDIVMPEMDGLAVLAAMGERGLLKKVPVILITAEESPEVEKRSYDLGAADMIKKPFDPYIVRRRVENMIELYRHKNFLEQMVERQTRALRGQTEKLKEQTRMLRRQTERLERFNEMVIDTLSTVVEYRNLESGQHIRRIRRFTGALLNKLASYHGEEYGLAPEIITTITSASAMHDIGKIAIPDSVLCKPGRLTTEEFEIMKGHTVKGCEILDTLSGMEDQVYLHCAKNICRYHHERWDGGGYPDGLKGEAIPISAQVVAIADVYDALTTHRVYKPAFPHERAVEMILGGECGAFSPRILRCFKEVLPEFQNFARTYADERNREGSEAH